MRSVGAGHDGPPKLNHLAAAGRPTFLQVAYEGRWEDAVSLRLSELSLKGEDEIGSYLERGAGAAVEVFFGETIAEPFIGVRPLPPLCRQSGSGLLSALGVCRSAAEVVTVLRSHLGRDLFARAPDAIELGVVNAWKSAGAIGLWRHGEHACKPDDIRRRLARAPSLQVERHNPTAVELAWSTPFPHWLGVPASAAAGGGYRMDSHFVSELAARMSEAAYEAER